MGTFFLSTNRMSAIAATNVGGSQNTLTLELEGFVTLQLNVDYIYREPVPDQLPPAYSETTLRWVGPEASPGPTQPRFNIIGEPAIVAG